MGFAEKIASTIAQRMSKGDTLKVDEENADFKEGAAPTPAPVRQPASAKGLDRSYVKKNRQDLEHTFKTDDSRDYNKKIKKFFGMED